MRHFMNALFSWQTARAALFAKLVITFAKQLKKRSPLLAGFQKLTAMLALLLGAVAYQLISKAFDQILCKTQQLYKLSAFDERFLTNFQGIPSNCCTILHTEKASFE